MRLLIDLQVCQGAARNRGMGRYSLSLAKAMIAEAGEHEVVIVMSTAFPHELARLRREFRGLLPAESIISVSMPPGTAVGGNRPWLRDSAERSLRRQLLALKPDAIHIPSVFSGSNDDVVAPWPETGDDVLWAVTLYDLIPLIRADEFLNDRAFRIWYEARLANLRRADVLLAISEASRTDAIHYLGLPADSVRMIGAAIEPNFSLPEVTADEAQKQLRNLGIKGDFVFYLGGCTAYKNFDGLLKAYAFLPISLRKKYKLVLAGQIAANSARSLRRCQHAAGLKTEEVVVIEKLSDLDLSVLYARCHVFIFPSIYEGFGLPIIEAMSCGAAVICSNTSSMVEVIGDESATFDPTDPKSISIKLQEVLEDESFRQRLIARGKRHAATFQWQNVARQTWATLEVAREKKGRKSLPSTSRLAMKIAVVASGPAVTKSALTLISELLPGHDDTEIEWIFPDILTAGGEDENCTVKSAKRITDLACDLDYVFYWIDRNVDERWIRPLMEKIPGIVVILSFFAGNHLTASTSSTPEMEEVAWQSHGYDAHVNRPRSIDLNLMPLYPCNLWLFENTVAVLSPYRWLEGEAKRWYGDHLPPFQVCLAIYPASDTACRKSQREIWKAGPEQFVFLVWLEDAPSTECGRALVEEAWRSAGLHENANTQLEFFYGNASLESGHGWIEGCDALVALSNIQRRGQPRAVIQALEAGKRVISNTEFLLSEDLSAKDFLIPLRSAPSPQELATAFSQAMKASAATTVVSRPADFFKLLPQDRIEVAKFGISLGSQAKLKPQIEEVEAMALALARQLPRRGPRQLLIDVTELAVTDAKSGIQRVVRCILGRFLKSPPAGFRVEPVRCTEQYQWVYARDLSRNLLGIEAEASEVEPVVEAGSGDIFLALDLNYRFDQPFVREEFDLWRARGVFLTAVVYDLLPMLNPQWFGGEKAEVYSRWLDYVLEMHAVIAISETVSGEIGEWLNSTRTDVSSRSRETVLGYFHLGADVERTFRAGIVPMEVAPLIPPLPAPSFLMVGTIEPRKGHDQTLGAFEHLWEGGSPARLVIVGERGWQVVSLITRIKKHPELGKRLIWLESLSDDELLDAYTRCQVLLAPSFGEGFGHQLIEGARHGLPVIARDIPVFREVAGEHAFYFSANNPAALANELTRWLKMFEEGTAPRSDGMKWFTLEESADNLWTEIVRCRDLAGSRFDELPRIPASSPDSHG
jgi:glycosyltransferase involved in cell wall biosynthesis